MALSELDVGSCVDGRYVIEAPLTEGGMGALHVAVDQQTGSRVVIKTLLQDLTRHAALKERFEREARALFALRHPHVVHVLDFGIVDKQAYIVTEYLLGQTLEDVIDDAPLPPDRALGLARQVLQALGFAHAQGVIHRDLKASNVFLTRGPDGADHVKLLDFGLVRFVDNAQWGVSVSLTTDGAVLGSPAYISPEQSLGGRGDARSDVYSAGVLLFELLTGCWPFVAEERATLFRMHLSEPTPDLAATRPGLVVHPELDALVRTAMAKPPADRYPDAVAMLSALEALPTPAAWLAG